MPAQRLTVTQAAEFLNVSDETLRRWEKAGYLIPERTAGGARRYDIDQLRTLKKLTRGKKLNASKLAKQQVPSSNPSVLRHTPSSENYTFHAQYEGYINSAKNIEIATSSDVHRSPRDDTLNTLSRAVIAIPSEVEGEAISYSPSLPKIDLLIPLKHTSIKAIFIKNALMTLSFISTIIFSIFLYNYIINPEKTMSSLRDDKSLVLGSNPQKLSYSPEFKKQIKKYQIVIANVSEAISNTTGLLPPTLRRGRNDKEITKTSNLKLSPSSNGQVLGSHIRTGKLSINTNTAISGNLEVGGDIILTGRLLGEGFVSSVIAGDNVTITEQANDDGSVSPIISVTIPTSVTSFQGSTGAITLTAGTGITIDGTKITASAKLSDVRSAGGCSGCITNDDVANDLTISSSGSVDVGALSGTVAIGKGGTGLTGYTKGDIMYTSATDTLAKLGIGTSGQVLTVSGGIPSWADSSGGVSSLTGTSNQISVSASTGAITLSLPSTVSLTTLNLTNALGISYGGTGATTASGARTALGLAIGTDVQAYDSKLTDIAELAATDGNFMVGNGTTWVAESGATARTSLGSAASGANSDITSLSGLTSLTINPDSIGSASLGTSDTSINFTTEANYTQQDATDGTDFSSGTVILHNAGGASGSDTFNHTGANQTFTVPTGVTSITVKMWGAGGGGNNFSTNGSGGGGGYSTATVSVTPGEDLTILVGQGGRGGYNGGTGAGGFGGGGSTTNATSYKGSGGGGYSGIFRGIVALGNTLVIAGGGGGAGLSEAAASANGGAGGGSSGVAGQAGDNGLKSGGAGTPSAGGAAGGGGGSATAGSALQGGAGGDGGAGGSGGGGGGGYFGGGGGGGSSTGSDGGGGGGSGYVGCAGCSATTTTAGSGTTPGNSGDADRAGLGDGGTGSNANGDNGIVLITYTGVSYPTAQSYYVTTAAATQIDSSSWTAVSSVSITQTLPTNTNIKYLVSFDNRSTWKYWSGSAWTSSTLANIDTNGMTKTTIEAITSSQWSDSGGFSAGTLDFAAALSTSDSASTPTLDLITVNYTSNAQGLAVTSSGSLVLGSAALATTATDGFLYLTSVAGTPTGTPTSYTGRNALVFDSTNNKLCNYDGSWLCSGALTDYAEWAPAEDADIADLVSVTDKPNTINDPDDPFMLGKSNTPYDSKIVGVVSEYAEKVQVANGYKKAEHYRAIALAGRVPVKVSTQSGSIRKGDFLTSSSVPGVAMKATRPGFVIGKALEAFECPSLSSRAQPGTVWNLAQRGDLANQEIASGSSSLRNDERGISIPRNDVIASEAKQSCQGKILTFIQPSYADPSNILANLSLDADGSLIVPSIKTGKLTLDPSLLTAKLETDITAIGTKVTQVEANNQGLEARIKSLESRLETLESSSSASPSPVTASASAAVSEIASPDEHRDRNDDIGLIDPSILLATGSASLANLEVQSEATFSGMLAAYDLSVSNIFKSFGETFLGKTTIAGDVSIDGSLSINGDSINTIGTLFLQNSPLAQSIDLFDGEVTISKDGLITANKLAIDPKSLDTIILKAGQTEVIVESAQIAAKSKIFTSPSQPIAVAITNKDPKKQSFTIKISVPLPTDLSIDWWIVDTR